MFEQLYGRATSRVVGRGKLKYIYFKKVSATGGPVLIID
jgi:hypothetical protein